MTVGVFTLVLLVILVWNIKGNDTFSSGSLSVHTVIFNIELKNIIQKA